jgi:2-oxoacid dehydrogenases acyltransferase (catalytic domain)
VAQAVKGMGLKVFPFLPSFLFRIGWWIFRRMGKTSPQVWTKYMGTVGITAVGMFGKGAGWGIPLTGHTLYITLGGIGEKPGAVDGQIVIREYLSMTISFDHDIVDGAPAARFTRRLKELIESGYGLDDFTEDLEQATGQEAQERVMLLCNNEERVFLICASPLRT